MRSSFRIAAAVFVFASAAALDLSRLAAAGNAPSDGSAPRPVELQRCLIKAVKTAKLATDRPGVLSGVGPKEGDTVREGEVVARLLDDVPQANLEVAKLEAESRVEIEYAALLNAVDAVEYDKALGANRQHANSVTDIEVRRLKLAVDRSRLQIDKARQETAVKLLKTKQAEAELKTFQILAPYDGVVTLVNKRFRGEAVRQGDTILQIVNTDIVHVEGEVSEKDIWSVKVGAPVAVRLNLEDPSADVDKKVFEGRIGFVDVIADEAVRKTRVWAEVANPSNILRPGLVATMTINPSSGTAKISRPALKVSRSSLRGPRSSLVP